MRKMKIPLTFVVALTAFFSLSANTFGATASPEIVVHLLDYLAKDYGGAVQGGKILSASEYREQLEFVKIVKSTTHEVPSLAADSDFVTRVDYLSTTIASKGAPSEVNRLARGLQQDAIKLAKIEVAPSVLPSLGNGQALYEARCAMCHGVNAMGDGPAGAYLDPKPANFHDGELSWNSSAYNFFNTIRLGVPGTAMAAFGDLSDEDVWALAFYLKSVPYKGNDVLKPPLFEASLKDLATLSDGELAAKAGLSRNDATQSIAALRLAANQSITDPLINAKALLKSSFEAAKSGQSSEANSLALRAYLEGIEPLEPKIRANIPNGVEDLESLMGKYRSDLDSSNLTDLRERRDQIIAKLDLIRSTLSSASMSPKVAFFAAFSIFLREGFEAVLIIIVLISILRAMGQPEAIRWVHYGWGAALALGLTGWFASGILLAMSGLSRELMEGGISVLAVAVLLYVGFWLHRHSEVKRWHGFLKEKLNKGLGKRSYFGLALVSFLAVFREAVEVVLFLRAIWLDLDSHGQRVASLGVLSSFLLLGALSIIAVKGSRKLPLGPLFRVCSWTMMCLALILAGKGVHSLQEAGVLPVRLLDLGFRADLFGLYPNTQTLSAQVIVAILISAAWFLDRPQLQKQKIK